jgi:hypothetical protein
LRVCHSSMKWLRHIDLFGKIPTDLSEATPQGASFSILAGIVMLLLLHIELYAFIKSDIDTEVVVDKPLERQVCAQLEIQPHVMCRPYGSGALKSLTLVLSDSR